MACAGHWQEIEEDEEAVQALDCMTNALLPSRGSSASCYSETVYCHKVGIGSVHIFEIFFKLLTLGSSRQNPCN